MRFRPWMDQIDGAIDEAGERQTKRTNEADGNLAASFDSAKCNAFNIKIRCIA